MEFTNSTLVAKAVTNLKGFELMGRNLRVDFADDTQRISNRMDNSAKRCHLLKNDIYLFLSDCIILLR